MTRYDSKDAARRAIWDLLAARRVARFPLPPHGRIPNFAGARDAAMRLVDLPIFRRARHVKVNPDAPQRPVRELLLRQGVVVFVPTPKLRGGFKRLDPARIPNAKLAEAANLKTMDRWATEVALDAIPRIDAIVNGSVAVTTRGARCGKGAGYGDIEYAILRELGNPAVPVATTVHDLQIVGGFPRDAFDLPVAIIATPARVVRVRRPPPAPDRIAWDRLPPGAREEMPVLRELAALGR